MPHIIENFDLKIKSHDLRQYIKDIKTVGITWYTLCPFRLLYVLHFYVLISSNQLKSH
jgi:hypothetical protein